MQYKLETNPDAYGLEQWNGRFYEDIWIEDLEFGSHQAVYNLTLAEAEAEAAAKLAAKRAKSLAAIKVNKIVDWVSPNQKIQLKIYRCKYSVQIQEFVRYEKRPKDAVEINGKIYKLKVLHHRSKILSGSDIKQRLIELITTDSLHPTANLRADQ